MTSIQQFCADTGRSLSAVPPMAVAAQPLTWDPQPPWQQLETGDPAAVIYFAPEQHRPDFAPNALGTCARIAPPLDAESAASAIAATADQLDDWVCLEDVAGEGDESAGAVPSIYRFIRGSYTAEPGALVTSSMIVAWSDDEATFVFQFVVTGFPEDVDSHRAALDGVRIGQWTIAQIVDAMRP